MNTIFNTKEEQLAAFSALFDTKHIKTRVQGGTDLMYYPVEIIRERLNEVFPGAYSIRTGEVIPGTDTVDMSTILTVRFVDGSEQTIEEWGSSDILLSTSSGKRTNDPYKNAASDSLKRCCAALGCGAELYNESYRRSATIEMNKMPERKKRDFGDKPAPAVSAAPPPPRFARGVVSSSQSSPAQP